MFSRNKVKHYNNIKCYLPDGDVGRYTGQMVNGIMTGKGRLVYPDN